MSCPYTVTRLIAEFPPTFTVWQAGDPATRSTGANDGTGSWSSLLPESSNAAGVGRIDDVRVGAGDKVTVGVGEEVRVGVGKEVRVGVGDEEIVGVGEGVGTVVSGGATTVM